jgi:hypothetical protein
MQTAGRCRLRLHLLSAKSMTEPRTHTLAFRLTDTERRSVNDLAADAGLQPSEFARRAILDQVSLSHEALDEALEQGREEVRGDLRAVEQELYRARGDAELQRRRAEHLAARHSKVPEELLAHVRRYLAGEQGLSYTIAELWGRVNYSSRIFVLPELVAAAADAVDQALAQHREGDDSNQLWEDVTVRYLWLMEALSPNAGLSLRFDEKGWRAAWQPLELKLTAAGQRRLKAAVMAIEDKLIPHAPTP